MPTDSNRRDAEEVKKMFGRVAPSYDIINRAMCCGLDILWRRRLVRALMRKDCNCGARGGTCKCKNTPRSGARDFYNPRKYIDIACGSGDVALETVKADPHSIVIGADFCAPMLEAARKKFAETPFAGRAEFIEADCENLPFGDDAFEGATISFGFRNFRDRQKCLREIFRVLKPGAKLCILEVSRTNRFIEPFQAFFMGRIVPSIAAVLGGRREDYVYLAQTTMSYPQTAEIEKMFAAAGFKNFRIRKMGFGLVALSCAEK